MSEQPTTSEQTPSGEPAGQENLSFMDKAAGVFYEPSKVFASIKTSPVKVTDWLIPLLILAVVVGVSRYVASSSPDLRFQAAQLMQPRFDKMVTEGKMSAETAQQAKENMENGSPSGTFFGIFTGIAATFIIFFIAAGIWLLIGKILKGNVNYSQMMGVAGLASWISIVGAVISIVVTIILSRLDGGLHLGMFTEMSYNKTYSLLRSADLFSVWNLVVTSIGIGIFTGKKGPMPGVYVFGAWIIIDLIVVFGLSSLFGG